jgi:hypothetical protein
MLLPVAWLSACQELDWRTGIEIKKGDPNKLVERNIMSVRTILLVVLILMLVGAIPAWPHSRSWGYYPSGGLGLVLVILIILMVLGRI